MQCADIGYPGSNSANQELIYEKSTLSDDTIAHRELPALLSTMYVVLHKRCIARYHVRQTVALGSAKGNWKKPYGEVGDDQTMTPTGQQLTLSN